MSGALSVAPATTHDMQLLAIDWRACTSRDMKRGARHHAVSLAVICGIVGAGACEEDRGGEGEPCKCTGCSILGGGRWYCDDDLVCETQTVICHAPGSGQPDDPCAPFSNEFCAAGLNCVHMPGRYPTWRCQKACVPGERESCGCARDPALEHSCAGNGRTGVWERCVCPECLPGERAPCGTSDFEGEQVCQSNQTWNTEGCSPRQCVPDERRSCDCSPGRVGEQICNPLYTWWPCDCSASEATPDASVGEGAGGAEPGL